MNTSLITACWFTLARTAILCLLAWPVVVVVERWLRSLSDTSRPLAFGVILAPFLFPELLVGYSFRSVTLWHPALAEWLCGALLFVRTVPAGVVALLASPSRTLTWPAIYCRCLLWRANPCSRHEWWQLACCVWYGPVLNVMPALCLMSVAGFQEFELAALLQTASWTDWFITAQRVGLNRSEMLMNACGPVVMQLPLLTLVVYWFSRRTVERADMSEVDSPTVSRWMKWAVVSYLGLALASGCVIPLVVIGWNLPSGLLLLTRQPAEYVGLGREVLIAAAISICAGMTAYFASSAWFVSPRRRVAAAVIGYALLVPGLIGSLLVGLLAVNLFQQAALRPLYDTPIPWLSALFVWLLPRALLLRIWVGRMTKTSEVHLAEILARGDIWTTGRRHPAARYSALLYRLREQPAVLAMGLLCYWAYVDLSTAYLLAPSGMGSGLVRLYNFMHFGRSGALSAEAAVFFGTPIFAIVLVVLALRIRFAAQSSRSLSRNQTNRERLGG